MPWSRTHIHLVGKATARVTEYTKSPVWAGCTGGGVEVTRETRPRPSVSRQQQQQPQSHVGGTTPPAGQQSALVRGGHVFPSPPALTSPWREMRFQLSVPSEKAASMLPADPAQQADAKRPRVSDAP